MAAILQQPSAATAASLQRPPHPPPIVAPSGGIRPTGAAAGPRLKTSPPKAVAVASGVAAAAGGAAKVVTSVGGGGGGATNVIMLPSSVTAAAPATKTLVTATKSLPPKEASPAAPQPQQQPRFVGRLFNYDTKETVSKKWLQSTVCNQIPVTKSSTILSLFANLVSGPLTLNGTQKESYALFVDSGCQSYLVIRNLFFAEMKSLHLC